MVSSRSLSTLIAIATSTVAATASPSTLNVTVLGAQNNLSTLECWALDRGFQQSSTPGTSGSEAVSLGFVNGNASFSILPARFDGGLHNAPELQWVVFISGLAHITLPQFDAEAWVHGGRNGAILALDTADVSGQGHYAKYPSDEETVALQVPFGGKGIPGHRVLHEGACKGAEVGV